MSDVIRNAFTGEKELLPTGFMLPACARAIKAYGPAHPSGERACYITDIYSNSALEHIAAEVLSGEA